MNWKIAILGAFFLVFGMVFTEAITPRVPGIPIPPECKITAPSVDYSEVFYSEVFGGERQATCVYGDRSCENTAGGCRHRSCSQDNVWNDWVEFNGSRWTCKSIGTGASTDYRCVSENSCGN